MTKITLNDIATFQNDTSGTNTINTNSDVLVTAFDNTLSRDGSGPNQMEAVLDMNSNRIINLPSPSFPSDPVRLEDVVIGVNGIPAGGATGQVLTKTSSSNYQVAWSTPSGVGNMLTSVYDPSGVNNDAFNSTYTKFLQTGTGAVLRTVQDKVRERVSAADFGMIPTNTGAQNVTAWGVIMTYAASVGGITLYIPRGVYNFNASIDFSVSNTHIVGDGIDVTVLQCTFASGDFITQTGTVWYQTIDNLTITSSVTRTSGAMFTTGFWKRGLISRVKITKHFVGLYVPQFEVCTLSDTNIVTPTGASTSIILGSPSATNQGAGFNLINCFIRGSDETIPNATPVGLHAIDVYDIENLSCVNTDISGFAGHVVQIIPQTRVAYCYFTQTYFDATSNGFNFYFGGTGSKLSFQFNGCWFASAGALAGGNPNCYGMALDAAGTYSDINITGCRFIDVSAAGLFIVTPYMDVNVIGCSFLRCGKNVSSTVRSAIDVGPSVSSLNTLNITGCFFNNSGGQDIKLENANATNYVNLSGNSLTAGISIPDGSMWAKVAGCSNGPDRTAGNVIASATTMGVSPFYSYFAVSGTATVNRIPPTFSGHVIALRLLGAQTYVDNASNLRLNGNLAGATDNILTLVCEANGDWREISRTTT